MVDYQIYIDNITEENGGFRSEGISRLIDYANKKFLQDLEKSPLLKEPKMENEKIEKIDI